MKKSKPNNFKFYKMNESVIIDRIILGEKELYEILVKRNNQKLYRVIRSYIKDSSEIEDIMQNTYLKAYEKLNQFKHASKFSTWLIRIAINETIARLREKNKNDSQNNHSDFFGNNDLLEIPDENQLDPEKKIIGLEANQLLEYIVDSLDIKYRSVYVMKEIEKMTNIEISECLNLSDSNVKVRLHRAKKMLKEKFYEVTLGKDIFGFGYTICDELTNKVMLHIL